MSRRADCIRAGSDPRTATDRTGRPAAGRGSQWHVVGERIVAGEEPQQFIKMSLTRTGDANWQAE